jgi:hypothetical protein
MQPAVVPPAAEEGRSPRVCSSLKAAALAFTRLLRPCASACSHDAAVLLLGVHVDAAVPAPRRMRRSGSCSAGVVSHAAAVPVRAPTRPWAAPACVETAMRRRAPCMERSLADGAPMRRLVLGELAARRREEMEAVHVERRRSRGKWQPPGDSRLRRMSLPDEMSAT